MTESPAYTRPLSISLFVNESTTTPYKTDTANWENIVALHQRRDIRPQKSGRMLGGYAITGSRQDVNVPYRSIIQLDIDTKGTKDKGTGRILEIEKAAPPINDLGSKINEYEWCAASSHWHEPDRGVTKYRIVLLPDRDIRIDEHEPVLEAIDEKLGGDVLDRSAWQWSQAFYLPSCPEDNEAKAFFNHNRGTPLPVDEFASRGREILQFRNKVSASTQKKSLVTIAVPETPENTARMKAALHTINPDIDRGPWRDICWSVAAHGWQCGHEIAADWSRQSHKWDAEEFEKVWKSFAPNRAKSIGDGTLYFYAKQAGWIDVKHATPSIRDAWESLNDAGNGDRLLKVYGDSLAYIADSGCWLIRHQERWHHDKKGSITVLATQAMRAIYREAETYAATSPDLAKAAAKHAGQSLQAGSIQAAIRLAATAPAIAVTSDQLDADNYLLGVGNGVLDLRTGTLRNEQREDWITRSAGVEYDPIATASVWMTFLNSIMGGNLDLINFLQMLAGYCLTGDTREQKFFFFYGGGSNGKSTFLNVLREMMGGYAVQARTEVLMQAKGGTQAHGHTADIMPLIGARLTAVNEIEEGQRLAESHIKQMTGGEPMSVRSPYGRETSQVMPQFKVIMAGNHRPIIRGTDHGIWRRLVCVPFTVTIPDDQQDKQLMDKLRLEFPGILNWALEGCLRWQAQGLSLPPVLQVERKAYMSDMDVLQRWIDERCDVVPGHEWGVRAAYSAFKLWATDGGYGVVSETRFAQQMSEKGFQRVKRRTGSMMIGLSHREGSLF
jgi:putative DNA primase/helicase